MVVNIDVCIDISQLLFEHRTKQRRYFLHEVSNCGSAVTLWGAFCDTYYMKLYSPQGQQYYTTIDSNNKNEGKTTDNLAI